MADATQIANRVNWIALLILGYTGAGWYRGFNREIYIIYA
jgi:hypothetical protein